MSETLRDTITWALVAFTFVDKILPMIIPDAMKIWSKKQSTEDRLFKILEQNVATGRDIANAMDNLKDSVDQQTSFIKAFADQTEQRLNNLESKCPNK